MKRYGWYNGKEGIWQVGDKDELNFLRLSGIKCSSVQSTVCATKNATRKFEKSILDKNKSHN